MIFTVILYVISNNFFKCLRNLFLKKSLTTVVCFLNGEGKLLVSVFLVPFFGLKQYSHI